MPKADTPKLSRAERERQEQEAARAAAQAKSAAQADDRANRRRNRGPDAASTATSEPEAPPVAAPQVHVPVAAVEPEGMTVDHDAAHANSAPPVAPQVHVPAAAVEPEGMAVDHDATHANGAPPVTQEPAAASVAQDTATRIASLAAQINSNVSQGLPPTANLQQQPHPDHAIPSVEQVPPHEAASHDAGMGGMGDPPQMGDQNARFRSPTPEIGDAKMQQDVPADAVWLSASVANKEQTRAVRQLGAKYCAEAGAYFVAKDHAELPGLQSAGFVAADPIGEGRYLSFKKSERTRLEEQGAIRDGNGGLIATRGMSKALFAANIAEDALTEKTWVNLPKGIQMNDPEMDKIRYDRNAGDFYVPRGTSRNEVSNVIRVAQPNSRNEPTALDVPAEHLAKVTELFKGANSPLSKKRNGPFVVKAGYDLTPYMKMGAIANDELTSNRPLLAEYAKIASMSEADRKVRSLSPMPELGKDVWGLKAGKLATGAKDYLLTSEQRGIGRNNGGRQRGISAR